MKPHQALRLCCIGGGKMGEALIGGLMKSGGFTAEQVVVVDPETSRRRLLNKLYKIKALKKCVKADVYILAVKPQIIGDVLDEIVPTLPADALIISIAAGVSLGFIRSRLGKKGKLVRAMPNAAAVVRKSATGLFWGPEVGQQDKNLVLRILDSFGSTVVVEKEDHLNIITGLSGSGPAYVFLFLEAMADAGVFLGLSRETAVRLALDTFLGSTEMAIHLDQPIALLREMIMSPGGTTVTALKVLEEDAVRAAIINAVEAATNRSRELSS